MRGARLRLRGTHLRRARLRHSVRGLHGAIRRSVLGALGQRGARTPAGQRNHQRSSRPGHEHP
ncbi:hypothetical protein [Haloactinomyces albus]|uniref:hypothetical protein n=1 Tax=Haloactinomyces albus TaxID=1352928 RepID=UPI004041E515